MRQNSCQGSHIQFGEAVFSGRFVKEQYVLEKYLIPGGGDYMLPAALFKPVQKNNHEVVLLLNDQGMEEAARSDSVIIHSMVKQGYSVLLFDIRGIGALGPGYLKGDAYIDNTSYNQWFASILTNKSIVGMRAEDILRIVHFIETDAGEFETISAIASGACGSEMLHAILFDKRIQNLCLLQPNLSYTDIALSREYDPALIPSTVAGAITAYDLPDLMAALSPRQLMIINPLLVDGSMADENGVAESLAFPVSIYSEKGIGGNFRFTCTKKESQVHKEILEWLNSIYISRL